MEPIENPYDAPPPDEVVETVEEERVPEPLGEGDKNFTRYAHLFLRLLGLLLIASGLSEFVFGFTHTLLVSAELRKAGLDGQPTPYSIASLAQGIAYVVAGIYFTLGGRWVLEKILLPSSLASQIPHEDEADAVD
jgi:hypothetical protein